MDKTSKKVFNTVFTQPVRTLGSDELIRVGGGSKDGVGPDNQGKDWKINHH